MTTQHPFSLAGKTALVAGASRGIGQAIAEALARAGARTILASRNMEALAKVAEGLKAEGCEAEARALDVASRESREALVAGLPAVDILVNVAGINQRKKFEDYSREEYDRLLETNLHGIVELTQAIGRKMIERGAGGKVIHIGSLTSVTGLPFVSVYTITKAALAGLTRALAAEWGRHSIQVNCIAPGFILTDLNRDMWSAGPMLEWLKASQANPRMGSVEDVAPLAVFLAGAGADYITGQVIAVDGGFLETSVWPFNP